VYRSKVLGWAGNWFGVAPTVSNVGYISNLQGAFVALSHFDRRLAGGFKVHPVFQIPKAHVAMELLFVETLNVRSGTWRFVAWKGVGAIVGGSGGRSWM
jgi:hypothetical protein